MKNKKNILLYYEQGNGHEGDIVYVQSSDERLLIICCNFNTVLPKHIYMAQIQNNIQIQYKEQVKLTSKNV